MSEDRRHGDPAILEITWDDSWRGAMELLPTGPVWPRDRYGILGQTVRGLVGNHWRTWLRVRDMLNEADPRTTVETIRMWEIDCGLPDPCVENPPTSLEARRAAVIAKRQMGATTRPMDFIRLAAILGYDIEIEEFRPFRSWSNCNDSLNTNQTRPYRLPPDDPNFDPAIPHFPAWSHVWLVRFLSGYVLYWMRANSSCNAFIREWQGGEDLRCVFERIKPAQTFIIWEYPPTPPPP